MTILRDATAINDGTTAIMAVSLRNHGDNGGATAVYAVQAPQWYRASGVTGVLDLEVLYTLPPGRPVHSDTNSASLGSIIAMQKLRAMTNHSHFQHCLQPGTHLYN